MPNSLSRFLLPLVCLFVQVIMSLDEAAYMRDLYGPGGPKIDPEFVDNDELDDDGIEAEGQEGKGSDGVGGIDGGGPMGTERENYDEEEMEDVEGLMFGSSDDGEDSW